MVNDKRRILELVASIANFLISMAQEGSLVAAGGEKEDGKEGRGAQVRFLMPTDLITIDKYC